MNRFFIAFQWGTPVSPNNSLLTALVILFVLPVICKGQYKMDEKILRQAWEEKGPSAIHKGHYSNGHQRLD